MLRKVTLRVALVSTACFLPAACAGGGSVDGATSGLNAGGASGSGGDGPSSGQGGDDGQGGQGAAPSSTSAGQGGSGASGASSGSSSGGEGGAGCGEEVCDGVDNDCDEQTDEGCACIAGDTQDCYEADPATNGVGSCKGGTQTCDLSGQWGPCEGQVTPAAEACNGADDDCDGEADEGIADVTCGQGACQVTVPGCEAGAPVPCEPLPPADQEVCNGLDDTCDGAVDEGCTCEPGDQQACYTGPPATQNVGECKDGQQICLGQAWGDCQLQVLPDDETCNGKDDDCDGKVDDGLGTITCGVGACQVTVEACENGEPQKCVPGEPTAETCNGVDDDCNLAIDDGLGTITCGVGECSATAPACVGGQPGKCTPKQPSPEVCNGKDDDCDGQPDDGNPGGGSACNTGLSGACAQGTLQCTGGKLECVPNVQPSPEVCNGKDDDCDGKVDDGDPGGGEPCATGKPGACNAGTTACSGGAIVCKQNVLPSNEVCDAADNDCDGSVDEGNPGGGQSCNTGQPGACAAGVQKCDGGEIVCVQSVQPSPELCDGKDNDCDGQTDEGNPESGGACSTGKKGVCAAGTYQCQGGSLECVQSQQPSNEACNGIDDDCDGSVDEGNPGGGQGCSTGKLGVCAVGTTTCAGGTLACTQAELPSAETCDGLDNDCDGGVDEGNPGGGQSCNTGKPGVCASGVSACTNGAISCVQQTQPSNEVCDGLDNNCNGSTDEGNPGGGQSCNTGQPGVCSAGVTTCSSGALTCNQTVLPSSEICDSKDNDCDGSVDEGNPGGGAACSTGLPGVCGAGTMTCTNGSLTCKQNVLPSSEVCGDAQDNDCDGVVDEGCPCAHDKCTVGAKLNAACSDPCVGTICAVDPYCCNTSWDSLCVEEVRTKCNSLKCAESQGSCAHTLCTTGTKLTNGCDSLKANCVATICSLDPYCCNTLWDSACVAEVASYCGKNCN